MIFWPFITYRHGYPKQRHIWASVRILRETDKAILINCGMKLWIPKSVIRGIRLRGNRFQICVPERLIG